MKKRIFLCLLAALLSLGTVSCGAPAEQTDPAETILDTAVETEETEAKPDLPERDFEGYTYRILTTDGTIKYIHSTEVTGEVVNDAVYEANAQVGEEFNITYDTVSISSNSDTTIIQAYIMAGDDAYDVGQLHDCASGAMALNGWFHNIHEMPYLDTTAEWWPQFTLDSLTLNGKMYYISNYTTYRALHETRVTFFNQDMAVDLGIESPYDMVKEGTWTIDNMAAISNEVYVDVNGDGKQDKGDIMGFVFTNAPYCWLESFGIEAYKKEAKDSPNMTLDLNHETTYTLIDKLHNWMGGTGNNSVWVNFSGDRNEAMEMFAAGSGLFTFKCIGDQIPYLMDTEMNYGIVPFPKVDEHQESYVSACTDLLLSIPITASDLERTGIITEAMSYAGYKHILPAYCEKALKNRYSTDEQSAEMLDMIFQNRIISFSYLFVNLVPGGMQYQLIAQTVKNNNVASYYQSGESKENATIAKIVEFYK